MGKKSKRSKLKPWCWYCERDFDDEKVLIEHQKAKHFKCHICNKRLHSAQGMAVHVEQVHKEIVIKVPNAISGRDTLEMQIFGMQGIPMDDIYKHEQKVLGIDQPKKRMKSDPQMAGFPAGPSVPMMPGFPSIPATQPTPSANGISPMHYPPMPHMMPPGMPQMYPPGVYQQPMPVGYPMYPQYYPTQPYPPSASISASNSNDSLNGTKAETPAEKPEVETASAPVLSAPTPTPQVEKKPKDQRDFVLVYSDNDVSIDEKRAKLDRYKHKAG